MDDVLDQVYVKSARGRVELQSRSRVLTGALRTALILVDGRSSVKALAAQLGPEAASIVASLLRAGYVERVEPSRPVRPKGPPLPAAPVTAPPPPDTQAPQGLSSLKRQALQLLAPHFGPDVALVSQPLLDAGTREDFERGLQDIERKLAIYMGKAQAARALSPLRA